MSAPGKPIVDDAGASASAIAMRLVELPGDEPRSPFTKKTVIWLAAIAVASFIAAVGFAIFGTNIDERPSARADTFSRSAIGHRGLVQLLKKLDIPVVISQFASGNKAGESALLVVAEPYVADFAGSRAEHLRTMLAQADTTLVVLPKRYGSADPERPGWVDDVDPLTTIEVEQALNVVDASASVLRPAEAESDWFASPDYDSLAASSPTLADPQLIDSDELTPIIWTNQGILLGEYWYGGLGKRVWVLADPDLISNHGLGNGNNAAIALGIVDTLRAGGAVVFDETMHGFHQEPSLWQAMFEFPLVIATLQILVAIVLLLWAATGRFGAPARAAPAIAPGKGFLINNTAALLRFGGHADHALKRYLYTTMQEVGRELHAPANLYHRELRTWLERIGTSRGVGTGLAGLENEVQAVVAQKGVQHRRIVLCANRIYRWRQEMTHGPGNKHTPLG